MNDTPGLFIQMYTDEDVMPELAVALREQGHVAESAKEANMMRASDEEQLTYATSRGMTLMTRNEKHFIPMSKQWAAEGREHAGIIVSEPFSKRQFGELLRRTLNLLNDVSAVDMRNTVRYLSQFR